MEEKKEVLREHLEDCLRHFGKRFNSKAPHGMRGRSKAMKPMVDFFGCSMQTVQHWLDDMSPVPKGALYVKLMCYLDLHGYRVIEFERMPKFRRNFAELIGFDVLSPAEGSRLVGYYDTQQIYQVISGREGTSKKKEDLMWNIWKEKRVELERRKRHAYESLRLEILSESAPLSDLKGTEEQINLLSTSVSNESGSARRLATLCIMRGLLGLLDDGLFNNLSESDILNFFQSDKSVVGNLSAHLSVLSSKLIERG